MTLPRNRQTVFRVERVGKNSSNGIVNVAEGNSVKFTFTPGTDKAIHSFKVNDAIETFDNTEALEVPGAARYYTISAIANGSNLTLAYCSNGAATLKDSDVYVGSKVDVKKNDAHIEGGWTFESSNPAIATVDETTGEVTGVAVGSATITLKNGGTTVDTCVVTVKAHTSGVVGGGSAPATYTITCGAGVTSDVKFSAAGKTITLTLAEDYQLVGVKDADGNAVAVVGNTFVMPAANVTVTASKVEKATTYDKCDKGALCALEAFTDLANTQWYHDGIHFCLDNGMMNGVGDGKFAPGASTTRGMIFTILARLDGETITSTGSNWYADGTAWAVKVGISDGTNPTGDITREQLAAILYRYAILKGYDVTASGDLTAYGDSASISDYAVSAFQWAVGAGVVNGDNGNLKPLAGATRAEVATMLMRFCEKVAK